MPQTTVPPLEVYKILNKSNCGDCHAKTCFAFASLVSQGIKHLSDCPHIPIELQDAFGYHPDSNTPGEEQQEALFALTKKLALLDFKKTASLVGGNVINDELEIKCLGKSFFIRKTGEIHSEIHVHSWITFPIFSYLLRASDKRPSATWVKFKELPNGMHQNPLYLQRCEKPLLKIANEDTALFLQVAGLFGKVVNINGVEADHCILLYPLPKFPILLCYTKPEEDFEAGLMFYYPLNTEEILDIDAVYMLAAGLTIMMEKMAKRHGEH
ncbi:MAG: DUF3786 domain-containing protein [Fibrobacteria bacterium]|nr:DUF3786 domain-containing protein [Fibrobacteria bacterium]